MSDAKNECVFCKQEATVWTPTCQMHMVGMVPDNHAAELAETHRHCARLVIERNALVEELTAAKAELEKERRESQERYAKRRQHQREEDARVDAIEAERDRLAGELEAARATSDRLAASLLDKCRDHGTACQRADAAEAERDEANRRRVSVTDSSLAALTEAGDRIAKLEAALRRSRRRIERDHAKACARAKLGTGCLWCEAVTDIDAALAPANPATAIDQCDGCGHDPHSSDCRRVLPGDLGSVCGCEHITVRVYSSPATATKREPPPHLGQPAQRGCTCHVDGRDNVIGLRGNCPVFLRDYPPDDSLDTHSKEKP